MVEEVFARVFVFLNNEWFNGAAELLEQFSVSFNFFFFACGCKEEILAEIEVEIFLKG
jgi:hypothetical protein